MFKKLINKIIMGTECYLALKKRYDDMEKDIKHISKKRAEYNTAIKKIKNLILNFEQKKSKEKIEAVKEIRKICKKIGE